MNFLRPLTAVFLTVLMVVAVTSSDDAVAGGQAHAAWVWLDSAEITNRVIDCADELGIERLWLSIGSSFTGARSRDASDKFETTLKRLDQSGFTQIGYLAGHASWLDTPESAWERVRNMLYWHWLERPGDQFTLNLDVEPQQREAWKEGEEAEARLTEELVDLVCLVNGRLKSLDGDAELVVSITDWMLLAEGPRGVDRERLDDCADAYAVMAYPRDPAGLPETLEELDDDIMKPFWAGINLRPEAPSRFGIEPEGGSGGGGSLHHYEPDSRGRQQGLAFHALNYLPTAREECERLSQITG